MPEDKRFRILFEGETVGYIYADDENAAWEKAEDALDVIQED